MDYNDAHIFALNDNLDIDDFFELNDEPELVEIEVNTGNQVFFNELHQLIETVATDREYCLFMLLASGKSVKETGKVLGITETRTNQLINILLEKIIKESA